MTSLNRALVAIALSAVVAGGAAAALVVSSEHTPNKGLGIVLGLVTAWAFVGTGLYAWWRRPGSRFGALFTAVGFTYLLGSLTASDDSVVFTIGVVVSNLFFVVFAHVLLSYPDGRLQERWHAWLLGAGYALCVVGPLPQLLWGWTERMQESCPDCPESALLVARNDTLRDALNAVTSVIGVAIVATVLVILIRRWRAATPPQRRGMAPILWSGVAMLVLLGSALGSDAAGISRLTDVLGWLGLLVFASVPWVFLIGLVRSRVARAGAVSELLLRLGEAPGTGTLRARLADALGDRSLQLVFWLEDKGSWVDAHGHPFALPADDDPARGWTAVELEGRRVGAIVHDRTLSDDPELLGSVAAAAGLAMENERLQAQLRARVEELRASRARIVEAGTQERRRLERNLHDGAQQRLVAMSLTLRLAQSKVEKDPEKAVEMLAGAQEELTLAQAELRELARGIHPAVLSDRGLGAALEALAGRAPIEVDLAELPGDRLPEPIEAAAYFVVAEALTNVAKYAHASHATVRVARMNGRAVVEVADDGIGGADPGRGSGLRGLADRVAALDGHMLLDSPAGSGTRLRAEIPV
ncbi:MAG TPA: sensor histidine kinase [Solirubrobacteraceae bacterium]|nr:sensor histidine kinase [Solirubrobacteraceae bacterium]